MQKSLRISLVIPVYNEERHLDECLKAAMAQAVPFDEIIVVDNNSTDNSVAIAKSYGLDVITESRQGVVFARNHGFDAARGDIIARIDADTRIPADWTSQLLEIFKCDVGAVSGRMEYYDMPFQKACNRIDLFFRRYFAKALGTEIALQAANMAIRRDVWRNVRSQICPFSGLHEDYDLAIHTNQLKHRVVFDERLVAGIAFRQLDSSFRGFSSYALLSPKTYRKHGLTSQRSMYLPVFALIFMHGVLRLLHRGYSAETRSFSTQRMITAGRKNWRVNPATFVD